MTSVPSNSAFYNRLRQSVLSAPRSEHAQPQAPAAYSVTSETMNKLRSIAARREGTLPAGFPSDSRSNPTTLHTDLGATPSFVDRHDGSIGASPVPGMFGKSPNATSAIPQCAASQMQVGNSGTSDSGDGLTPGELDSIRVAEIDAKFSVSANVSNSNEAPPTFTRLADETTIKVFPRHVVFSRSDGSPVVELVIAELFELTEDAARESLSFHLQRSSGVAVIEVSSKSVDARSVLYKLVCAKRNSMENGR